MKKERIFYLDFIRAIATFTIVLTHYNALFLYLPQPRPDKCLLLYRIFNIYIGNWGVSLFFIISGAALMYTYDKKFGLWDYYKRRMKSIYPMWWIAYIMAASYWFLKYKTYNPWGVPSNEKWKIILSILGFDAYFEGATPVFKFIGEWFLGCIILMYIIFPLLRRAVQNIKTSMILVPVIILLYFLGIYKNNTLLATDILVYVRIPEFLFGMIYMKYWKNNCSKVCVCVSVLVLAMNQIVHPSINATVQTTYVGIASFLCLVFIAEFLQRIKLVKLLSTIISKYSYPVFLLHHLIIYEIAANFDLNNISEGMNAILFLIICEIVAIGAYLLYKLNSEFAKCWGEN